MHDEMDTRNVILADIIDKMHGRMADKMFPPDPSHDDQPAVTGITMDGKTEDGHDIPAEPNMSKELPKEEPRNSEDTEMSDEDLDEMLKYAC